MLRKHGNVNWEAGYDSFHNGVGHFDNPFSDDTDNYNDWLSGWNAAEFDFYDEDDFDDDFDDHDYYNEDDSYDDLNDERWGDIDGSWYM